MGKKYKVLDWVNMGQFPGYVMVSAGLDYNELTGLLKKKKATEWLSVVEANRSKLISPNYWGIALQTEKHNKNGECTKLFHSIILRDCFDFKDESYSKLAHEILHICQFYLPDILDRNREIEAEAYLHTHIMNQCLQKFRGNLK